MGNNRKNIPGVATGRFRPKTNGAKCQYLVVECPVGKKQAAEILGVSVDTLDQWTVKYGLPHYKYDLDGNQGNRGEVVYLASDLVRFRERFRVQGRRDIPGEVEDFLTEAGGSEREPNGK